MSIYYVYAYLRNSNNTLYYIGKGHSARMFNKNHSVSVPSDRSKIVVLAENLSNTEACDLERSLIRQYGRKDLGTGILRNRTDGAKVLQDLNKLKIILILGQLIRQIQSGVKQ